MQDSINVMSEYDRLQQEMEEEESKTDIRLNLLIDATPDATMKIIMDPIAGDYISGKGSGNIRTEFFNKGDVKCSVITVSTKVSTNSVCKRSSAKILSLKTEAASLSTVPIGCDTWHSG